MNGRLRHILIGATAGNVSTTLQPGAGKRWYLVSGRVGLVTDVTVANRYIVFGTYMTGAVLLHSAVRSDVITASLTRYFSLMGSVTTAGSATIMDTGSVHEIVFDHEILEGSDYATVSILGGVAGDSYSGVVTVVEAPV